MLHPTRLNSRFAFKTLESSKFGRFLTPCQKQVVTGALNKTINFPLSEHRWFQATRSDIRRTFSRGCTVFVRSAGRARDTAYDYLAEHVYERCSRTWSPIAQSCQPEWSTRLHHALDPAEPANGRSKPCGCGHPQHRRGRGSRSCGRRVLVRFETDALNACLANMGG
jgi:hypothetical protein